MKRRAGSCGGAEVSAAEVVEGRRGGREIGIGAALKGETHVRARNGHFRRRFKDLCCVRFVSLVFFPLPTYSLSFSLLCLSLLFHLRRNPLSPLYKQQQQHFHNVYNLRVTRHSFVLFFFFIYLFGIVIKKEN